MTHRLAAQKLTLAYGQEAIIRELDLQIPEGKITVFVGRNGCGKSTLLRSLARLLPPKEGAVVLDGKEIAKWSTKDVAKRLAILPQGPTAPEGLTVLQLVKQGRYPYQSWLQQWSEQDERIVNKALAATKLTELAERPVESLSGGQRQRAWIAMTLTQDTSMILLDEPTTYLDLTHQLDVLDLLAELNEREQRTIVMVLHDINLACRYAHHIVAVADGTIYAQGKPTDVVNEPFMKDVFGLECRIMADPVSLTPMIVPLSKRTAAAQQELQELTPTTLIEEKVAAHVG